MDLSKIDFTKCKLEPLPCLMADGATKQLQVFAQWDALHQNVVLKVGENSGVVLAKTGHGSTGWQFMSGSIMLTTDDACLLIDRAEQVNLFIASETARIEAEEEAANWVQVPCQDVVWLQSLESKIRYTSLGGEEPRLVECELSNDVSAFATWEVDKRTFPSGYDPTKPRWVNIHYRKVAGFDWNKCSIRASVKGKWVSLEDYCKVFDRVDGEHVWQVDAHTLPPGVPLHVEPSYNCPPKTSHVGLGMHDEPKPEPRPCTREFALRHPNESEFRCRWQWVEGSEWSNYCPMSKFHNEKQMDEEFRTTAKEEPSALRLPTVKLPEGSDWLPETLKHKLRLRFVDDGENSLCYVPHSVEYRNAMAACVAAYDEIHGANPRYEIVSDYCRITTTELHYISSDITGISFRVDTRVDDKQAREIERLCIDRAIVRVTIAK